MPDTPQVVTFPVVHWKTNEPVGRVTMNYGFKCYYEGVTIYMNDTGYPFVRSRDLVNRKVAGIIDARVPRGRSMGVHTLNYYIETGKWSEEGVTCLHHRNHNKMDARISNLELLAWNYNNSDHNNERIFTQDQHDYVNTISKRMTGHDLPTRNDANSDALEDQKIDLPPTRKVVPGENIPVCPVCDDTSRIIIVNRSYVCLDHPWSFDIEVHHE